MPDHIDLPEYVRRILKFEESCTPPPWRTHEEFGKPTILIAAGDGEMVRSRQLHRQDLVLTANLRNRIRELCEEYLRLHEIEHGAAEATA